MKRGVAVAALVALVLAFASIALAGERQEIVSKRTEFAKVFDNGDGTYTAEIQTYPVHKKGARGDWVEIADIERGVGKAAVNVSNYNVYTVKNYLGNRYAWITSGQTGYTSPSDHWINSMDGPYIGEQYATAYLFYLAGVDAENTTSAYYTVNYPFSLIDKSFNVARLSSNPRWADSLTVYQECCGTTLATCSFDSSNPITVTYSSMAYDVVNSASAGFIAYGHREDTGPYHLDLEYLGTSATLCLTITPPARKVVQTVPSVSVSPNPFNPATTLNFSVAKAGQVELTVYNQNGQKVESLVNDVLSPGKHSVSFHGENLGSGIYFYQLHTDGLVYRGKMLLVK